MRYKQIVALYVFLEGAECQKTVAFLWLNRLWFVLVNLFVMDSSSAKNGLYVMYIYTKKIQNLKNSACFIGHLVTR